MDHELTRRQWVIGLAVAALHPPGQAEADPDAALLRRVQQEAGLVLLMRHAIAPGGGDPPGFRLEDCSTQRNLSGEGRDQARHIGERLRALSVPVAAVWHSQWCRARDGGAAGPRRTPTRASVQFLLRRRRPRAPLRRRGAALAGGLGGPGGAAGGLPPGQHHRAVGRVPRVRRDRRDALRQPRRRPVAGAVEALSGAAPQRVSTVQGRRVSA